MEYTKGPWEAGKLCTLFNGEGYNFSNGDVDIFPPLGESGPVAIANSVANANLISAAPEMYEELKSAVEILRKIHHYQDDQPVLAPMLKALSKAEGKVS